VRIPVINLHRWTLGQNDFEGLEYNDMMSAEISDIKDRLIGPSVCKKT
jgi:hypothetical protein